MKNKLLFILAIGMASVGKGQETMKVPDNNGLDAMLENVDKSAFTTGILYDRVYPLAGLTDFNEKSNISNLGYFEQALSELYRASNQSKFIPYQQLRKSLKSNQNNSVSVGIINVTFQKLNYNPDSPKKSGLYLKDGKFRTNKGKPAFTSNRSLIIAPLNDYVMGSKISFDFSDQYRFEESSRKIDNLVANFGTGKEYVVIQNGKFIVNKVDVEYLGTGYKTLEFKVTFADGGTQNTNGVVHVKTIAATSLTAKATNVEDGKSISTIPFKGYTETTAIYGEIDYRIFYGNTQRKLLKPLIVIDGFDPQDKRRIEDSDSPLPANEHRSMADIMTYTNGGAQVDLIAQLRTLGYDVVLVNHPTYTRNGKQIDGGADYIERNAYNLVTLINKFNTLLKTNGSTQKLVIVGPSMGGQISRYALAYMEKNNLVHNTRLWVSVDSPHLGANIPLGLQSLIYQLKDESPAANDFLVNQLGSIAAKQQLIEQFKYLSTTSGPDPNYLNGRVTTQGYGSNSGEPFFRQYYTNLFSNGTSGSKGYPQSLRKIALVNGSMTGSKEYSNPFTNSNDTYGNHKEKSVELKGFQGAFVPGSSVHISSLETYFMPAYGTNGLISRFFKIASKNEYTYMTNQNSRGNMDNVPGGWFPSQAEFVHPVKNTMPINSGGSFWTFPGKNILSGISTFFGGSWWELRVVKHSNSFISSMSAIGHKSPERDWAQTLNRNLVCSNETPFNTYFGYEKNTQHTSFTKESLDWLLKELANNPQEPYFPVNPNNLVGESSVCDRMTTTYTFNSCNLPGKVQKWEVSSNLQKISETGTSVTIRPHSDYRTAGYIKATFKNGVVVTKNIWVGMPASPSSLTGPTTVITGALVSSQGTSLGGATSYKWLLPYPFDEVASINYNAQNWQMRPTSTTTLSAFTGYSKKSGLAQFMGVNKCGTGGAKT